MEANMIWVCAECGSDLEYCWPGHWACAKDKKHFGQIKKEDWERKEALHEVAQQDIRDMFGPEDMR